MRNICVTGVFIFGFSLAIYAQSHFEMITHGDFKVGFKTMTAYDTSRPAVKEQTKKDKGRVIQVNLWYPSANCDDPKINFNNYVNLLAKEVNPYKDDVEYAHNTFYDWTFQNSTASSEMLDFKKNGVSMNACLDPEPYKDLFPVVLLIHGGAADFAFLGEFLASHGYVIINVPYKGHLKAELDVDVLGMETEIRDFEFALKWLSTKMPLDTENISLVGASFGGQSAISFSMRKKVNCIVSLDGGIGSAFGAGLLQSDKNYDLKNIVTPLLHLYNPYDTYTDLTFIRRYKYADRKLIGMKNMEHAHFWSWGILDRYIPDVINKTRPGNSYEAVLQATLNFIDRHSKDTPNRVCNWCTQFQSSVENLQANRSQAASD